jgi:predicted flap endonuclease-1-like 5' DNA nuclease
MPWKRLLLLVGAAALIWLRPWRRLRRAPAGAPTPATLTGATAPAAPAWSPAPAPMTAPATPAAAPPVAEQTVPPESFVAPEDAFGVAPQDVDLDPADLEDLDEPAPFAADLGTVEVGEAITDLDGDTLAVAEAEAVVDSIPAEATEVVADAGAPAAEEPDAELEPELIAAGEPELVEMAEDDLIDVPGSVDDATHAADLAAAAVLADEAALAEYTADAPADDAATAGAPATDPARSDGPADDLLIIEGIGPRTSTIVTAAGYTTFAALAEADVEQLREMLVAANVRTVDPSTWPEQAALARDGRLDELRELQRNIKHGKKTK